jgi:CPA2 family monovalent cation:H+ antiporter-2
MHDLFIILLSTILLATIFNVFLKKIDIPTIIGYIFSGLIIAEVFDIHGLKSDWLNHIGEFGIVFLMFTIGLGFSIRHLVRMKKEVFVYGFLQVFLTGNFFGMLSHELLGLDLKVSIILGFAVALSSTAIVLKILNENGEINSGYGRRALGILLFQDLAVIPILLMIGIFSTHDVSISELLLKTLIDAVIVLLILFVIGKYVIEKFFRWITAVNSEEIFLVSVLFVVIGASVLAHNFGFSYSLGAFIAGMTIAETKFKYRIEADLIPFRDILLGVFFVTVGMQIDLSVVGQYALIVLGLVIGILFFKALIIYVIFFFFSKTQKRTSIKSAFALFQVGEFALAILSLSNANGLLDEKINQIMIVTVVVSMIITPFVIKNIKKIADFFVKEPELEPMIASSGYKNHVVIFGYGPLGQKIAKRLKDMGVFYVVVEHSIKLVELAKQREEPVILANAIQPSTFEAVGVKDASAVIVAVENEEKIRLMCEALSRYKSHINIVVKVANKEQEKLIEDLDVSYVVNESQEMANILIDKIMTCSLDHK